MKIERPIAVRVLVEEKSLGRNVADKKLFVSLLCSRYGKLLVIVLLRVTALPGPDSYTELDYYSVGGSLAIGFGVVG